MVIVLVFVIPYHSYTQLRSRIILGFTTLWLVVLKIVHAWHKSWIGLIPLLIDRLPIFNWVSIKLNLACPNVSCTQGAIQFVRVGWSFTGSGHIPIANNLSASYLHSRHTHTYNGGGRIHRHQWIFTPIISPLLVMIRLTVQYKLVNFSGWSAVYCSRWGLKWTVHRFRR